MSRFMCAIVIGVIFNAATGAAQDSKRRAQADTLYEFDDDLVQGDLLGPDVEVLHSRRRGARDSLIRAREHFIDRLLASVEDL